MRNPVKGAKKHHYLICGTVFFVVKDEGGEPQGIGNVSLNAMSVSQFNMITAKQLGAAQQALQMRALQKVGEVEFVDVVIQNICHLGHMTDEEFGAQNITPDNDEPVDPTLALAEAAASQ